MTTRRRHGPQPVAFALTGGMDLVSAQIQKRPGMPIAALNYEPVAAGYRRLKGFERYDGKTAPSAQQYLRATVTGAANWTVAVGGGITINGLNYTLAYKNNATAPTAIIVWDQDGLNGVTLGAIAGTGGTGGTASLLSADASVSDLTGTSSGALKSLVAGYQRANISALSGSGPVRGVFYHDSKILAVRDNALGTAGIMFRASSSSWVAVGTGRTFTFNSGGTAEITPGDFVTGATSGATGYVTAVTLTSGTWAAGTAAGTITINVQSGTFQNGENIDDYSPAAVATFANILTLTNAGTAYALPAGGFYEFLTHNFFGASNLTRMYGVNGVGKAFEYTSGANSFGPITTGMTTDTPTHLAEHKGALFLSFPGGSLQFSSVGNPLDFSPVLGAGEIGIGSNVTALISANKTTLGILADNAIGVLYGHDSSEYQLEVLTDEAGAIAHSAQRIGQVIYLDNEGVRSLSSSAVYGNFNFGSMSQLIAPFLEDKRIGGIAPAASYISREKGQYWLIFTDGTGIVGFFGRKVPEWLPFNLGITVTCACSAEIAGNERIFLGASNGYVYEFDVGTSFDGSVIEHYLRLPFNNFGSPQIEKRVHKVILDIEVPVAATLSVSVDFDYGSVVGLAAQTLSLTVGGSAMTLGTGESYYAAQIETFGEVHIDGVAKNFSLKIAGSTSTESPHTLSAVTYLISARGLAR